MIADSVLPLLLLSLSTVTMTIITPTRPAPKPRVVEEELLQHFATRRDPRQPLDTAEEHQTGSLSSSLSSDEKCLVSDPDADPFPSPYLHP